MMQEFFLKKKNFKERQTDQSDGLYTTILKLVKYKRYEKFCLPTLFKLTHILYIKPNFS